MCIRDSRYAELANQIREAFLQKWFDPESGRVASGSQACQVFSLWLGLVPEPHVAKAVDVLVRDLAANQYRITTGNLCTRYLFDVLTEYGHIDDAWELITREEYPSIGYKMCIRDSSGNGSPPGFILYSELLF